MKHELKTWIEYFEKIITGEKKFEVRFNDRGFKAGDILLLKEYDSENETYTGRKVECNVHYVLPGNHSFGIDEAHCVMFISMIEFSHQPIQLKHTSTEAEAIAGVWVKASQRLPVVTKKYAGDSDKFYCCVKSKGLFFSSFFNSSNNTFEVGSKGVIWSKDVFGMYDILWLDESASASSPSLPIDDSSYHERLKAALYPLHLEMSSQESEWFGKGADFMEQFLQRHKFSPEDMEMVLSSFTEKEWRNTEFDEGFRQGYSIAAQYPSLPVRVQGWVNCFDRLPNDLTPIFRIIKTKKVITNPHWDVKGFYTPTSMGGRKNYILFEEVEWLDETPTEQQPSEPSKDDFDYADWWDGISPVLKLYLMEKYNPMRDIDSFTEHEIIVMCKNHLAELPKPITKGLSDNAAEQTGKEVSLSELSKAFDAGVDAILKNVFVSDKNQEILYSGTELDDDRKSFLQKQSISPDQQTFTRDQVEDIFLAGRLKLTKSEFAWEKLTDFLNTLNKDKSKL